jgi:hypothetical protein
MEVTNVHGGLVFISPLIDDLFTMPIPTPPKSIESPLSKGYDGKNKDVYPPNNKRIPLITITPTKRVQILRVMASWKAL